MINGPALKRACALLCLALAACNSSDHLTEEELTEFASENVALSKKISSNGIDVEINYRPTDLLVAYDLKGIEHPSDEVVHSKRIKYHPYYYFIIRLSHGGQDVLDASRLTQHTFNELLQTISFRMGEFVRINTPSNETIPVADYVYSRAFGLSKSTDIMFVFERAKAKDHAWIQIQMDEFGLGIGKQSIRFDIKDLENSPKIFKF